MEHRDQGDEDECRQGRPTWVPIERTATPAVSVAGLSASSGRAS